MTDDELAAIEARCEAATPGPWRHSGGYGYILGDFGTSYKVAQLGGTVANPGMIARDDSYLKADTAFIANARTDVPALIAEVKRLRAMLGENVKTP